MATTREDLWEALLANRERAARVARARGARPADVEDCVQEAMARVAAMPEVDLPRVGPLVTVVVAHLAADGHRGRDRASRLERRLTALQSLAEPSHDDAVCDADEARWLWSLRGDLAPQDRRVLELRAQGRSVGDAAAELGVTYKAAENALGRARKRLKTAWAATTALLGILWGRRPAQPAAAAATLPALALALATLAVLSPVATPTGPAQGPADATAAVVRPDGHPDNAASGAGAARAEPVSGPAPVPERAAPPPVPPRPPAPPPVPPRPPAPSHGAQEPIVQTEPVEALDQQVGPATVETDDEPSLVEDVERCLREGPVLGPYDFGCPP